MVDDNPFAKYAPRAAAPDAPAAVMPAPADAGDNPFAKYAPAPAPALDSGPMMITVHPSAPVVAQDTGEIVTPPGGQSPIMPSAPTAPGGAVPVVQPDAGGNVDALVRGIANGPTLGAADRIAALAGAATGIGGTFGDYSGNLKAQQAAGETAHTEHPAASITGELLGSLALPAGIVGATTKATSLAGKAAIGAGTGAGLGAVQGAMSAPDLTNVADTATRAGVGGAIGFGFGGTLPLVGAGIGAAYRAVGDRTAGAANSDVGRKATSELLKAIEADNPEAVKAALADLGDHGMLADAGPSLLGVTQGQAIKPGPGKSTIVNALTERNQGTNDRVQGAVNEALGPAESPVALKQTISDAKDAITGPLLARADAAPAPVSPVMDELAARPAIEGALRKSSDIAANEGRPIATVTLDQAGNVVPDNAGEAFLSGSRGRMDSAIATLLGHGKTLQTADEVIARRAAQAKPDYDKAFAQTIDYGSPEGEALNGLLERVPAGAKARANQLLSLEDKGGNQLIWNPTPNADGTFQLAAAPNPRQWDYIRRGLQDEAMGPGTDSTTGRLNQYGGAVKTLVRDIDKSLNPAVPGLTEARANYASHSDMLDALRQGRDIFKPGTTREQVQRALADMSPGEQEMYRLGGANAMREKLANTSDTATMSKAVFGNQALRDKLDLLAPNREAYGGFRQAIANENQEFTEATRPTMRAWRDAYSEAASKAAKLGDTPEGKAAGQAAQDLRRQLATNPEFKTAVERIDEYERLGKAVDRGGEVLDGGKSAIRPEDLVAELATLTKPEFAALKSGSRAEIDRLLGTKANDLVALKQALQGEGGWNAQKLASLFGEKPAALVTSAVDREGRMRGTFTKVVDNSQTAQRNAAAKAQADADAKEAPNLTGVTWTGVGATALQGLKNKTWGALTKVDNSGRDAEISAALTKKGPEAQALLGDLLGVSARRPVNDARARQAGTAGSMTFGALSGAAASNERRRRDGR